MWVHQILIVSTDAVCLNFTSTSFLLTEPASTLIADLKYAPKSEADGANPGLHVHDLEVSHVALGLRLLFLKKRDKEPLAFLQDLAGVQWLFIFLFFVYVCQFALL